MEQDSRSIYHSAQQWRLIQHVNYTLPELVERKSFEKFIFNDFVSGCLENGPYSFHYRFTAIEMA
jgi:hypothetical protein